MPSGSCNSRKTVWGFVGASELHERRRRWLTEEEEGRTPWRAGGLSSKNGELWLIFGREFWIAPTSVFVLSRKVCPSGSRFFFSLFFCPYLLFCWEYGKYWDVQGLDKYFSALGMAERWMLLVVKMRKRTGMWGTWRPPNWVFGQTYHFFNRIRFSPFSKKEKVLDFRGGKESNRHKMVSFIYFHRRRDRPRQVKKFQKIGPVVCAFRAMFLSEPFYLLYLDGSVCWITPLWRTSFLGLLSISISPLEQCALVM